MAGGLRPPNPRPRSRTADFMYSNSLQENNDQVTSTTVHGEVLFGVQYKEDDDDDYLDGGSRRLLINVERARGLIAATPESTINSYIKTYLRIPNSNDAMNKRRTAVIKHSTNPIYDQILKVSFI